MLVHGLLFASHAFRSSGAVGIASNLSGPVPISALYGSWQSVVVYSCSLPGALPPVAPMPLDLNQRHKSSEEYFNLHHSVILLLQGEFNFKITPLSSNKAGSFPFLEFLLIAPSLQRISSTFLHHPGLQQGGCTAAPWGAESLQSWVVHHPWGPVQLSHTSTLMSKTLTFISSEKLMVGDHSLDTGRSMRVSKSSSSAHFQPSLLSLHCPNSPLGIFPTWILLPIKDPRSF